MDMRRVFILGSKVGYVTRHAGQLFKVKGQGHKVTCRIGRQKRYNSAMDSHINFKLGGNYRRWGDILSRSVGQTNRK